MRLNRTLSNNCFPKSGDTRARNLRKFSIKFLHLCVDVQYPSNTTSTYKRRNLLKNLRMFIASVPPLDLKINHGLSHSIIYLRQEILVLRAII